jgi:hypothetical protein
MDHTGRQLFDHFHGLANARGTNFRVPYSSATGGIMKTFQHYRRAGLGLGLATGMTVIGSSNAAIIFSQDFEAGLGAGESVVALSTGFGLTDAATLGNGTFGIGHTEDYANRDSGDPDQLWDYYSLTVDLGGFSATTLSFDYSIETEDIFDEFGVYTGPTIALVPISGFPSSDDSFNFPPFGLAASGIWSGTALFDLSPFDGSSVTISIGLSQDASVVDTGTFIDNVLIEGTPDETPMPIPATLPLLGLGLVGLAGLRWRRRAGRKDG